MTCKDERHNADASPFHAGERAIQTRLGVRDQLEQWGRRGIRSFMPDQHREFFRLLPLFIIGAVDDGGRPWGSALVGRPGFVDSPDPQRLHVGAMPGADDPIRGAFRDGAPIGGLGIELHTRRRNRVNGRIVLDDDGTGFTIVVDQSFGNCKQYINARQSRFADERADAPATQVTRADHLDEAGRALIARADTCFIASYCGRVTVEPGDTPARARDGVDVSHRGGLPGFVHVADAHTLMMPDYRGNFFFNTLGNLVENPRCGLSFIDFDDGTTLQLTGAADIVWDVPGDAPWDGAERLVRVRVDEAVRTTNALPLRWELLGYAPQFPLP